MRLIATADIHGKQYRVNDLLKNIEEYSPEIVIICGDITHFGPGEHAKILLDQIPVKTLAVHGNVDSEDVLEYIDKSKARVVRSSQLDSQSTSSYRIFRTISRNENTRKLCTVAHFPSYEPGALSLLLTIFIRKRSSRSFSSKVDSMNFRVSW